jgi:hypothetical protein
VARGAVDLAERDAGGEVLGAEGNGAAAGEIETAVRLFEEKGNVAGATAARLLLESAAARA